MDDGIILVLGLVLVDIDQLSVHIWVVPLVDGVLRLALLCHLITIVVLKQL